MAYYDKIANKWHEITGYNGGAFKKYVLNQRVISKLSSIQDMAILELGAGNGYFLPLVLRYFSGQKPSRIVITDISVKLLNLARKHFQIPDAEYYRLDIRGKFPFNDNSFKLILATMVYNEISINGMQNSLRECRRVLSDTGQFIVTVTHPEFTESLSKRDKLKKDRKGILTMPGAKGLRLPVFLRTTEEYTKLFQIQGFEVEAEAVFPTQKVLTEKTGLKDAGHVPLAIIYCLNKRSHKEE
jgi:ubiquinone/menaquinone biosynthesis C-methylase UbiE